jgi:hypothetical protein
VFPGSGGTHPGKGAESIDPGASSIPIRSVRPSGYFAPFLHGTAKMSLSQAFSQPDVGQVVMVHCLRPLVDGEPACRRDSVRPPAPMRGGEPGWPSI